MSQNPNIPVRTALISAIKTATGLDVWHKKVPKDITPLPAKYILLQNQSKLQTEISKDCWEWQSTISIDITYINPAGFSNTVQLDNTENQIMNVLIPDNFIDFDAPRLDIPNWFVKDIKILDSTDLDAETSTQSIERRILTIIIWLWPM